MDSSTSSNITKTSFSFHANIKTQIFIFINFMVEKFNNFLTFLLPEDMDELDIELNFLILMVNLFGKIFFAFWMNMNNCSLALFSKQLYISTLNGRKLVN